MQLLEDLKWRYATKKFDPQQKVAQADIEKLKEAIHLSASSYGLQPYEVLIIEDKKLKEKLRPASWNQSQIEDASHLFVFCHQTELSDSYIDNITAIKAKAMGKSVEDLSNYSQFIKTKMKEKTASEMKNWTARQTYIALGNLLAACGELKIDACPMEGFEPDKYDQILGLTEKGLSAAVLVTVGYRSGEDVTAGVPKTRKEATSLFHHL